MAAAFSLYNRCEWQDRAYQAISSHDTAALREIYGELHDSGLKVFLLMFEVRAPVRDEETRRLLVDIMISIDWSEDELKRLAPIRHRLRPTAPLSETPQVPEAPLSRPKQPYEIFIVGEKNSGKTVFAGRLAGLLLGARWPARRIPTGPGVGINLVVLHGGWPDTPVMLARVRGALGFIAITACNTSDPDKTPAMAARLSLLGLRGVTICNKSDLIKGCKPTPGIHLSALNYHRDELLAVVESIVPYVSTTGYYIARAVSLRYPEYE